MKTTLYSLLILFITSCHNNEDSKLTEPYTLPEYVPGSYVINLDSIGKVYGKLLHPDLTLNQIEGFKLFKMHCISCHNTDSDFVGPKMVGVTTNRSDEWLTKMISNGNELIKSGDETAVMLFNKWNKTEHPSFILTKKEVNSIIDYLKSLNKQNKD